MTSAKEIIDQAFKLLNQNKQRFRTEPPINICKTLIPLIKTF